MDAKRQFSVIGWALTAYYLICIGMQVLLGILFERFGHLLPEFVWTDDFMMILSHIIMYGIAFPVFVCMVRKLPYWFKAEKKSLRLSDFFVSFVICLGTAYVGNLVGTALMLASDLLLGTQSFNPVTNAVFNLSPGIKFLTTVVAAPLMEEWMFRKILIERLVPYGQKTAVVVSGLSFGLFHGNFYQFFYAFSLGMIFAYLYSYTGKLRYNVLLHMGVNLVGGMLPLLLERLSQRSMLLSYLGVVFMGFFAMITIVTGIVLAVIFGRKLTWFPSWAKKTEKGLLRTIFSSAGVWGFLLVCAAEFTMMF